MNNGPLFAGLWVMTWQADNDVSRPRRARRRRLRNRAKEAVLWPDLTRNGRKLFGIPATDRTSAAAKALQTSRSQG